jgi:CheY-like chemotaxis protein
VHFNWWAKRVSIVAGPALLAQALLLLILKLSARKVEAKRVKARLKRLDTQADEARVRKIEEGRRLSELTKLRNDAKRRSKAGIKHILIVDHENDVIEPLTNALIECGHEVTTVADIDAAILDFDVAIYDVIMIDIFQEHMGGLEGLSGLRGNKYETRVVPMSAGFAKLSDDEVQRAAAKIGVEGILVKPLDFTTIPTTIASFLGVAAPQPPAKEAAKGATQPDAKKRTA